jgi:ferredoxin-NADP reductase
MAISDDQLRVRVRSITYLGEFINAYEVVALDGHELPPFTAGGHIDLFFRDGRIRQYSLCNEPHKRQRYVFAVQREANGRGGSKAIFEIVHVGRTLVISKPRNNFPLATNAKRHLFLAGGIGITPIMAMIHQLKPAGGHFELHYSARTPKRTAFVEELAPLVKAGKAFIYHDEGDPSRGLKIGDLLKEYCEGTHLYYCGPSGYMAAVKAASAHWPAKALHWEHFTAPIALVSEQLETVRRTEDAIAVGFQVKVNSTGAVYDIPNDKSIATVLRENGIDVVTSCENGLCGTCRTRYLAGAPERRDYILSEEEKIREVLICCARSRTPMLVLDL